MCLFFFESGGPGLVLKLNFYIRISVILPEIFICPSELRTLVFVFAWYSCFSIIINEPNVHALFFCLSICFCLSVHVNVCACMRAYMRAYMCAFMRACVCVHECVCVHACVCVCACVFVCVC